MADFPQHDTPDVSRRGVIPHSGEAAFTYIAGGTSSLPILISVPHAGRSYPEEVIARLRAPDRARLKLEDRFVDMVAKRAAKAARVPVQIAVAPRAILDLNRSADDIDFGMVEGAGKASRFAGANRRARHGLGLVPRRVSGLGELWRRPMTMQEIDDRIAGIHQPYHTSLKRELEGIRDRWGVALLLDIHSMPPLPTQDREESRIDFVIGDRYSRSCGADLSEMAIASIETQGRRALRNRPYSGGYILDRFGQPAQGIHAMQVEICRSTYLDSKLDRPSARLPAISRILAGLITTLGRKLIENYTLRAAAE